MPHDVSFYDSIRLKDAVKDKLVSMVLNGDCEGIAKILTEISKAREAIDQVFEAVGEKYEVRVWVWGDDDIERFLRNGLKCFDDSVMIFKVNVDAVTIDEYESEDVDEDEDFPVTQTVRVNNIEELMRVLDKVDDGKVPVYGGAVDASTFMDEKEIAEECRGRRFTIFPNTYEVMGIDDLGYEAYVEAVKIVGNAVLSVRTWSMAKELHIEKEHVIECVKVVGEVRKKYGIKNLETYVSIEIHNS